MNGKQSISNPSQMRGEQKGHVLEREGKQIAGRCSVPLEQSLQLLQNGHLDQVSVGNNMVLVPWSAGREQR